MVNIIIILCSVIIFASCCAADAPTTPNDIVKDALRSSLATEKKHREDAKKALETDAPKPEKYDPKKSFDKAASSLILIHNKFRDATKANYDVFLRVFQTSKKAESTMMDLGKDVLVTTNSVSSGVSKCIMGNSSGSSSAANVDEQSEWLDELNRIEKTPEYYVPLSNHMSSSSLTDIIGAFKHVLKIDFEVSSVAGQISKKIHATAELLEKVKICLQDQKYKDLAEKIHYLETNTKPTK